MIVENFIGRIYKSNNFGDFKIIDSNKYSKIDTFVIQFLDTGFITEVSYEAVRHGSVKDKMVPIVADIGFIGSDITITDKKYYMYYKSWNDMINRCYNVIDNDYPLYGKLGVSVDPEWYNFTTFYHDCQLLPNYLKKVQYPDVYQLDKDYLQFDIPIEKRIYSKYTCIWISDVDNKILMGKKLAGNGYYYGVLYRDNSYCTVIDQKIYGRFIIPEAAAYLYNLLYHKYGPQSPFHDIVILNPVRSFTYQELLSYMKPGAKQNWFNDYPWEKE